MNQGKIAIRNVEIINEGQRLSGDLLIESERIARIGDIGDVSGAEEFDGQGAYLIPGVIDDQVHFREPGLTHKADLTTESRAAAAGGVTSFMEMPNTVPQTLTQELLEQKYQRAAEVSRVNYSFFMGASNHNLDEVLRTDPKTVCGVKVFMGSSTGDMLVDEPKTLEGIFKNSPVLVATHCEKEELIRAGTEAARDKFGDEGIPISEHPNIRSREACYASSSQAVELARQTGGRLHVLHISSAEELELFQSSLPRKEKRITSEACIHHLWFCAEDYERLGSRIKWNPAVKLASDRAAIRQAVIDGVIDVVATDHAPHTLEEKQGSYLKCPSGGPLVQFGLLAMFELAEQGVWSLELLVDRMCHAPAELFDIERRGFIREGYQADLTLVRKLPQPKTLSDADVISKCGWTPFAGQAFQYEVAQTWVNGSCVYRDGQVQDDVRGQRLSFER